MGNSSSTNRILDQQLLSTYVELTYLKKSQVQHIIKLLDEANPGKLCENPHYRFTADQVDAILPQIRWSPFRDSIYRVFSSDKDGRLSLEDILDLCSAFSKRCPENVRATWAFQIFDFDGDDEISLNDLVEAVRRLTCSDQVQHADIDTLQAEHVAEMVLQEVAFNPTSSISSEEFVRFASRIADFSSTFCFKM